MRVVLDVARRLGAMAVLDVPGGHEGLAATEQIGADLVALCCRAQPRQLRASAECLRELASGGVYLPPVIGVVTGLGRAGSALASGSDVTAGWVRLPRDRGDWRIGVLAEAADLAAGEQEGQ